MAESYTQFSPDVAELRARLDRLLQAAAERVAAQRTAQTRGMGMVGQMVSPTPVGQAIGPRGETIAERPLTAEEIYLRGLFGGTRVEQPMIRAIGEQGQPDVEAIRRFVEMLAGGQR